MYVCIIILIIHISSHQKNRLQHSKHVRFVSIWLLTRIPTLACILQQKEYKSSGRGSLVVKVDKALEKMPAPCQKEFDAGTPTHTISEGRATRDQFLELAKDIQELVADRKSWVSSNLEIKQSHLAGQYEKADAAHAKLNAFSDAIQSFAAAASKVGKRTASELKKKIEKNHEEFFQNGMSAKFFKIFADMSLLWNPSTIEAFDTNSGKDVLQDYRPNIQFIGQYPLVGSSLNHSKPFCFGFNVNRHEKTIGSCEVSKVVEALGNPTKNKDFENQVLKSIAKQKAKFEQPDCYDQVKLVPLIIAGGNKDSYENLEWIPESWKTANVTPGNMRTLRGT